MKAKRPTLTITGPEATSLIAQMWNKLPPHAQKPWNDKACQDETDSAAPPAKSQKADADASPSPPSPATPKWSQAEVDAMTVPKLKGPRVGRKHLPNVYFSRQRGLQTLANTQACPNT
mmetsp:Transcript_1007/g.2885  ORF Transcript_1007/g.2885 Transcript_1007/m.2885 type:complete len:118 (+) Transcript_1007:5003-5356(+)